MKMYVELLPPDPNEPKVINAPLEVTEAQFSARVQGSVKGLQKVIAALGKSHTVDLLESQAVQLGLFELEWLLRAGRVPQWVLELMADFVWSVNDTDDVSLGRRVLGRAELNRLGPPDKGKLLLAKQAAAEYESRIQNYGDLDEQALRVAWQIYHPDVAYDKAVKAPAGDGSTVYLQQLEKVKTALHKAGVRSPTKAGRKPKVSRD